MFPSGNLEDGPMNTWYLVHSDKTSAGSTRSLQQQRFSNSATGFVGWHSEQFCRRGSHLIMNSIAMTNDLSLHQINDIFGDVGRMVGNTFDLPGR